MLNVRDLTAIGNRWNLETRPTNVVQNDGYGGRLLGTGRLQGATYGHDKCACNQGNFDKRHLENQHGDPQIVLHILIGNQLKNVSTKFEQNRIYRFWKFIETAANLLKSYAYQSYWKQKKRMFEEPEDK